MRGIPDKLATREDVYNVAMDLPPDQAMDFLDKLTPAKVKGLLNAEELTILKGNVAWARWRDRAHKARLAQKKTELKQARRRQAGLKKSQVRQGKQLQKTIRQLTNAKLLLAGLNAPMTDHTADLAEEIGLAKNRLAEMSQQLNQLAARLRALAAKRASQKMLVQDLVQGLETHKADLAAGHDPDTLKKITAAKKKLHGCRSLRGRLTSRLAADAAEEKAAGVLIEHLKSQIGELNNG